jgi:hypothetical protein
LSPERETEHGGEGGEGKARTNHNDTIPVFQSPSLEILKLLVLFNDLWSDDLALSRVRASDLDPIEPLGLVKEFRDLALRLLFDEEGELGREPVDVFRWREDGVGL